MKNLSELKLSTTSEVKIKFDDKLEDFLARLSNSVEYIREETDIGTVVIIDNDCEYCTHELHFDNNGKFLGFFTNCADGTDSYDNGLEIIYSDKSTFKGTLGEMCNELCEEFITIDTIEGLFGGDIGVHYSKWITAVDGSNYVIIISEMRDDEEILAIIREDKLIEFGITVDDVDIANEIINN